MFTQAGSKYSPDQFDPCSPAQPRGVKTVISFQFFLLFFFGGNILLFRVYMLLENVSAVRN